LPFDIGFQNVVEHFNNKYNKYPDNVNCYVEMKGQYSGGTIQTGIEIDKIDKD